MASSLFTSVETNDKWRVNFLLSRGIRINLRDSDGENILVTALKIPDPKRRKHMFKWLLSKGADIMAIGRYSKRDMLTWAARLRRSSELDMILEQAGGELDLSRRDAEGYTGLHYGTLHGDCEVVEALCKYMRKFDIPVDIRNSEGMTPFLLAKRIGHSACARLLQEIGQACPHMGDGQAGQSEHFWKTMGGLERTQRQERERDRVVGMYKQMGRLPQLIKAKYNTDHIQLVPSKEEKKAIAKTGKGKMKRHGVLEPLDVSAFDPTSQIVASKIHENVEQEPKLRPAVLTNIYRYLETDHYFRPHTYPLDTSKDHTPRMMRSILEIASEQCTDAYKPAAKPPKPKSTGFGVAAHATSFGMRLKRRKDASKKFSARSTKERLPVILQSQLSGCS